jgi:hypothetical protein
MRKRVRTAAIYTAPAGGRQKAQDDVVDTTVFEVALDGRFPGAGGAPVARSGDNDKHFSDLAAGAADKIGFYSYDDANGDGTSGDMDNTHMASPTTWSFKGTIKPGGLEGKAGMPGFHFTRDVWTKWFHKNAGVWQIAAAGEKVWDADSHGVTADEDVTPSATDHIYSIDGPGWDSKTGTTPTVVYANFREHVSVTLYGSSFVCSNWFLWHSQTHVVPAAGGMLTRGARANQLLGADLMAMPVAPPVGL